VSGGGGGVGGGSVGGVGVGAGGAGSYGSSYYDAYGYARDGDVYASSYDTTYQLPASSYPSTSTSTSGTASSVSTAYGYVPVQSALKASVPTAPSAHTRQ
jgi:hypothetical protein